METEEIAVYDPQSHGGASKRMLRLAIMRSLKSPLVIQFPPEMDENWVRYGLAKLGQISRLPNWQKNCCLVCTQHNFCTQQLRYVGITMIVILFGLNLCVETLDR